MHRYNVDTVGRVRTDCLHKAKKYIETAMQSAQYTIDNTISSSEKSKVTSERNDRVTLKLEVGQVVYIPGATDLQTNRQVDSTKTDEIRNLNKEQRVIHYLKIHDSISTRQAMELREYKTQAGC